MWLKEEIAPRQRTVRRSCAWLRTTLALAIFSCCAGPIDRVAGSMELGANSVGPNQKIATNEETRVDFSTQIQPILQSHCIECHGPKKQKGELRLDGKEFIVAGGHTGNAILADRPDASELFLRITSDDPKYRMPAKGSLLNTEQIQLIRRWLEQGAKWATAVPAKNELSAVDRWVIWLEPFFRVLEKGYSYIRPIVFPLLVFLIGVYLVERAKHRQRWTRADTVAAEGLALVRREWYLVGALALGLVGLWSFHQRQTQAARQAMTRMQESFVELNKKEEPPVQRGPLGGPVPPRPKHVKQLGGTYYRGNDERDTRLFNGGFYRTATMHLRLADADGKKLNWGDQVGAGLLYLELEIERAKHATPALFTDAIMQTIFMSRQVALLNKPEGVDTPAYFENVEPGQRWLARYPIRKDKNELTLDGMIYVYKGHAGNGTVNGKFHYGISYDVRIVDGAISPESELWMGSLSVPVGLIIPPPDRMVLNEWFDFRPLPEVEGVNTTDPALLGIPEYVK